MTRIALGIQYIGTDYHGWQRQTQPNVPTLQAHLEAALNQVAPQTPPITTICAGRTDSGVHAVNQVVHFDTQIIRPQSAWLLGTNTHLPDDITVTWAQSCTDEFHARYSAVARCYRYIIDNSPVRSALWTKHTTGFPHKLDIDAMQAAANILLGEHDFSSFRAANCQSHSTQRYVHFIKVYQRRSFIIIDIQANAFLHHMVRNIVGVLLDIGRGKLPTQAMETILAARDRTQAGITAPAQGLYLLSVTYPEHYKMPITDINFTTPFECLSIHTNLE